MRKSKDIRTEAATLNDRSSQIKIEVLLDIRDLLLRQELNIRKNEK